MVIIIPGRGGWGCPDSQQEIRTRVYPGRYRGENTGLYKSFCTLSFIQIFEKYLSFCGVGIQNAQLFEASVLEYKKNQLLLSLAKSLFQEQSSLDRLITTIIREAKDMLKCERCTIFLLDLKMYDQVV